MACSSRLDSAGSTLKNGGAENYDASETRVEETGKSQSAFVFLDLSKTDFKKVYRFPCSLAPQSLNAWNKLN